MLCLIKSALSQEEAEAITALNHLHGIGVVSAEQVVAETGIDMSHFRNHHAFSNWIGVAPCNNESACKRKTRKTNHGNKAFKSTLTQCAKSAWKLKDSFFCSQYHRLVLHRGKNRATMAVAHSIAIYFDLQGNEFKDFGADYYTQFNHEKKINSHLKQPSRFGIELPEQFLPNTMKLSPN